ncbi:MAG TPA: protein kinase [Thermoanaerobaculia bacterium]|nr:protein kinase [Thermoanaerobaculia bacterium]
MQSSWEPDFFVADWLVRPALGKLERGEVSVAVESRAMQVLSCLARHAPDVVSKQRLMREVWGGIIVNDEVLSHAIWELRKAFGDEAKSPRYIQTLARKGYRLVAEVSRRPPPGPLAPGSRVAQYEILEPVAGGAMGEVYKARDTRLGRTVALKFLPAELGRDPSARKRFEREAQAVAQLDHPNLATIYDTGETEGGRVFLVLAFYEGETLQQKLERGPLPLPEVVEIACQIAKGLAAAHQSKIVHRDIKPANIVVLPGGTVKILDFGLAKMGGDTTLTRLGFSPGTPAYKSPEQTKGEPVDPRSDLWALGVVLYEMVAGRVPFGGDYEQAVIYAILHEPPRPLDDSVPAELAAVIHRALDKEAAKRYQAGEEMEVDLARIPLGDGAEVAPRSQPRRPVPRKWIVAGLALALAVALGFLYWKAHRWDFSTQVKQYVEQGDQLEWRGDTEHILGKAEKAYRRALALEPENPVVMAYLAALLTRTQAQFPDEERLAEIRRWTDKALELGADHPMPWVAKAKLLLLDNKPQEAEQAAREAIDRDQDFDRGYTVRGEALILLGEKDKGLEEIKRGTEVGDHHLRAHLVYGIRLKDASYYEDAAIELRKVLNIDPNHPSALHNLGEVYLQTGREVDALPQFLKAWQGAGDWRSANSLGNVYLKMGHEDDAIEYFRKAYNIKPHPTVARNLAEAYEKLGEADKALSWYKTALQGFDNSLAQGGSRRADLLLARSFCAAKLGRFVEAINNIQDAMELKPDENAFLLRAADVYFLAGRRDNAFGYLRRAVQGGLSREEIREDFVFQPLQDDPEFRAILEGD